MKRALLALILALPLAVSAQFRIVGTGLFTTINDSTYRAKIDFRPDLTGNSYNPTQLNDSMLVLSQKGQLYRLDSFYNASFSSAFIIVVEKNGNWGSPVGQIMVFQNNSSLAAPQAVYGANGATAGMQAGVDTWNALLLKVVSDSAVYWSQAYSNSIDSAAFSGTVTKTLELYRASGDTLKASFVITGGADSLYLAEDADTTLLTNGDTLNLTAYQKRMPFDSVTFNVNETDASLRELKYSEEKGYLQYGGQDSVQIPILPGIWYVRNDTSVTIPKGTVLRATGTLGASGRIKVKHMIANGSIDAMYILGIAMHDIAVGADGYAMSQGKIRQVNTQAYSEGAVLYADVDTLGGLTQTEPGNGFLKLPIAFVVHSASNGVLAVRVTPGAYMRDLHDVEITSPATNASLYYNTAQGIWRDTGAAVLVADTATMLSSYISNADTSVFARDFQISGTTNYIPKFTGSNAVGNSVAFNTGRNIYINSTQDNSASSLSNSFQFNGYGSNAFDQPNIGVFGNTGTNPNHRPYLAMYRSFGDTANSKTLVPYNSYLGSIVWHGADGVNLASRGAEIGAITDSITGVTDMPTALFFGTTTNGVASPTERMRITSPGNVGINTTTPAHRLDVNGDVNTTGVYKKSGTDIISGTTNRLAMFTGANTVGNAPMSVGGDTLNIITNAGFSTFRYNRDFSISSNTFAGWPVGTRFYSLLNGTSFASVSFGDGTNGTVQNQAFMQLTSWTGGGANFYSSRLINNNTGDLGFYLSSLGSNANPTMSATPHLMILNGGNVGINTSSPSRPLHVNANSSMIIPSGATGTRPAPGAYGDLRYSTTFNNIEFYDVSRGLWERPLVGTVANNKVAFASGDTLTSNTNFHWDNATTKLGIGNAAPDSTLTVTGGSRFSGGVSARNYTFASSAAGNRPALGIYSSNTNRISFATNDTLRFEILAAGTATLNATVTSPTAPAFALTVNGGGIQARNYLNLNGDTLANSAPQITVANRDVGASGGYVVFQKRRGGSGAVQNGDEVGTFSWGAKINATAGIFASAGFRANVAGTVTDTFAPVDFTIFTSPRSDGSTSRVPVKTDRLTIKPSGRVGINTASPSATLHVNGNLSRNAPKTVTDATHTVDSLTNWIICNRTNTITLTLPDASSWTGREIMIKTIEPQAVISASSNVVPLIGGAAGTSILGTVGTPPADGAWCTLVSDGTNWIIMQQR